MRQVAGSGRWCGGKEANHNDEEGGFVIQNSEAEVVLDSGDGHAGFMGWQRALGMMKNGMGRRWWWLGS